MNRSTAARIGIAGAVAGAGLAVGGVAIATADSGDDGRPTTSDSRPGGPRGGHGPDAALIAEELGLKEAAVRAALDAVRDDLRPDEPSDGTRPTPPTDAQRAARRAALAAALAEELDVSEAKVEAALTAVQKKWDAERTERRKEARADLVTRLDAAVKAGTLTATDKTSVLKAYDADIIGGPGGGRGGPMGGRAGAQQG